MHPRLITAALFAFVAAAWVSNAAASGTVTQSVADHASNSNVRPIDFDTQVMPVLTKAGCNAGACHGAAAGRGEFRLSLYGSRSGDDHEQIVHALQGRRINRRLPASSLLLNKATESISHGGGPRLDLDGEGFALLQQWISEGASRQQRLRLQDFTFAARRSGSTTSDKPGQFVMTAEAVFDDGSTQDVTRWAVLTAADDSAVFLNANVATVQRPGRHLLLARYLDRVEPLHLTVPYQRAATINRTSTSTVIDRHIQQRLDQLGLVAEPPANDAAFLRRVSLDLTGRLPSLQAQQKFARQTGPEARERLIQDLLNSEDYVDYWTFRLAKWLRLQQSKPSAATRQIYDWLRGQVGDDAPISDIVQTLLLADGDVSNNPLAAFQNQTTDPRLQAEFVTEAFMGVRLKCANCHDHPLDAWTQDDYHGLAAIFATIKRGPVIRFAPHAEVIHPATGEPALPRLPGGPALAAGTDHRNTLANWLTAADNEYFSRAIVNRVWSHLMGRGLVDPVDDLRVTNPGSHPELLQELSITFAREFRLKVLLRNICKTDVYRRRAQNSATPTEAMFYASATNRPMPVEVYLDAVADVTGIPLQIGDQTGRAISRDGLWQLSTQFPALAECELGTDCESTPLATHQPSTQLNLLNGALLNDRLQAANGRLMQALPKRTNQQLLTEFYARALCRQPTDAEQQFWLQELSSAGADRAPVFQDLLWSLLNSSEFLHLSQHVQGGRRP